MSILSVLQQILSAITGLTNAINGLKGTIRANPCGCPVGEGADNVGGDGTTIPGQTIGGIEFIEAVIVDQGRCDRADYIYRSVLNSLTWLATYDVVGITGATISGIVGLYSLFLVATGPFGVIITGVAGLIVAIALAIITLSLDLDSIVSVLTGLEDDIICCLYNATDTAVARQCVEGLLTASVLDSGEVGFVMQFMPNGVISLLFADTDESVIFFDTYEAQFDCSVCIEPSTDWMLLPPNSYGVFDLGHPELGVGAVSNDGAIFTINSVQFNTSTQTLHGIGLIVKGYYDDQVVPGNLDNFLSSNVELGSLRNVSGTASTSIRVRRKTACTTGDTLGWNSNPGSDNASVVAVIMWRTSAWSVDLAVSTPPSVCP